MKKTTALSILFAAAIGSAAAQAAPVCFDNDDDAKSYMDENNAQLHAIIADEKEAAKGKLVAKGYRFEFDDGNKNPADNLCVNMATDGKQICFSEPADCGELFRADWVSPIDPPRKAQSAPAMKPGS